MRAGGKGKGRMREDWYRPRVQGHECEGYRTSLPPGRANLSDTVQRHSLFHAQKADGAERRKRRSKEKEVTSRRKKRERIGERERKYFSTCRACLSENIISQKLQASADIIPSHWCRKI